MNYKLFFTVIVCAILVTGCRFSFEESDYVGHYEGTYRLANFSPSEGDAVLDITSSGSNKCDLMFCAQGQDSIFYSDWVVDRYSQGVFGVAAWIHPPGGSGYNEVYISKYNQHATLYLSDTVSVHFSGERID